MFGLMFGHNKSSQKILKNDTHMLSNMKITKVTHQLANKKAKRVMETAMAEKSQVMVTMTMKGGTVTRPKIPVTITMEAMKHGSMLTQSNG